MCSNHFSKIKFQNSRMFLNIFPPMIETTEILVRLSFYYAFISGSLFFMISLSLIILPNSSSNFCLRDFLPLELLLSFKILLSPLLKLLSLLLLLSTLLSNSFSSSFPLSKLTFFLCFGDLGLLYLKSI
jgi:hypothetical protein